MWRVCLAGNQLHVNAPAAWAVSDSRCLGNGAHAQCECHPPHIMRFENSLTYLFVPECLKSIKQSVFEMKMVYKLK